VTTPIQWARQRPWIVAGGVLWLALQVAIVARTTPDRMMVGPDGLDFVRISGESLLSADFWATSRAPIFPLLVKFVGLDRTTGAQVLIAGICWLFLAVVLASKLLAVGRAVVFVGVLLLGATVQVSLWNGMALSESLTFSLMAASIAVTLLVIERWTWPRIAALAIVGSLFVLVRDTDSLLALAFSGVVVVGILLRKVPPRALVVVLVLVVVSLASMASSSNGDRWLQPLHHVVRDRVVRSPSATEWFVDRGLPDVELVRSKEGDDYVRYGVFWKDPRFQPYLTWLREHGRTALITYMARHPSFLVDGKFADPTDWAGPRPSVRSYQHWIGADPPLGSTLNAIVWPESPVIVYPLQLAGLAAAVAVAALDRRRRTIALVGVLTIVSGWLLVVMAANLDTAETPRHIIALSAMIRLGTLCGLAAALESGIDALRQRGRQPATA
jgi:hypothetical protein